MEDEKIRLDKFLWAVRIYKTRKLSAEACDGGKVKVNGRSVKASQKVNIQDEIYVNKEQIQYIYSVKQLLSKRIGAPLVKDYIDDLTPQEELAEKKLMMKSAFYRPRGLGRPTKKDRRQIDGLLNNE
ncbi:RNA-binding S4 domain-containing protein [Bacteroidota bacterium]